MTEKTRAITASRFGRALVAARTRAGITQHGLEEKSGVSRPAIARYEAGRTCPRLDDALVLAQILDLSLDELG